MRALLTLTAFLFLPQPAFAEEATGSDRMFLQCNVAQLGQLHLRDSDQVGLYFPQGLSDDGVEVVETFDESGVFRGASFNRLIIEENIISISSTVESPSYIITIKGGERDELGTVSASFGLSDDEEGDRLRFGRCFFVEGHRVDEAIDLHRPDNGETETGD